jgi:hypothetical protein
MYGITTAEIRAVNRLWNKVVAVKFHRAKKDLFLQEVRELPEAATLLLAFCGWFCLFNPRFKFVEASRYYFIPPSEENATTFDDFLNLVKHYENKRITRSREGELCRFLTSCISSHLITPKKQIPIIIISSYHHSGPKPAGMTIAED